VCLQEVQADQLETFYHQLDHLGKNCVTITCLVDVIHLAMMRVSLAHTRCLPPNCTICMNLRVVTKLENLCTNLAVPPYTLIIKYLIHLTLVMFILAILSTNSVEQVLN
jgi:hypothetical protein